MMSPGVSMGYPNQNNILIQLDIFINTQMWKEMYQNAIPNPWQDFTLNYDENETSSVHGTFNSYFS